MVTENINAEHSGTEIPQQYEQPLAKGKAIHDTHGVDLSGVEDRNHDIPHYEISPEDNKAPNPESRRKGPNYKVDSDSGCQNVEHSSLYDRTYHPSQVYRY